MNIHKVAMMKINLITMAIMMVHIMIMYHKLIMVVGVMMIVHHPMMEVSEMLMMVHYPIMEIREMMMVNHPMMAIKVMTMVVIGVMIKAFVEIYKKKYYMKKN